MTKATAHNSSLKNTTHKVVVPFYIYAALALLAGTIMLFVATNAFHGHYFHPQILAITHIMALGWGTMMILGASHQLVPVLIESELHSIPLAYVSFFLAAAGIPMLVYGFYQFRFDWITISGGVLINLALVSFLVNIAMSISKAKKENVHAIFIFTATSWLLITTILGLLLVINFTHPIFNQDSLQYLSLHAHMGIAGWFLLLVIGVGTRLIPMFLVSKYEHVKKLWIMYWLMNSGLLIFILIYFAGVSPLWNLFPLALILGAVILFGNYCFNAYQDRIRKRVDQQMKISVGSVAMMALPLVLLGGFILLLVTRGAVNKVVLAYGFTIFFGWLTAIILGMTFKTLPFIIWNKLYQQKTGIVKTPNPKDLFSEQLFRWMLMAYLPGFVLFFAGVLASVNLLMQAGTVLLLAAALLYNWNVVKMVKTKPV